MTTKKSPLLPGQGSGAVQQEQTHSTTAREQRQRLLNYLRVHGSCSTIEAREGLDIIHPAGRVLSLRKAGEKIETVWTWDITEQGKPHRVAKYLLAGEGGDHD
jgi:hypothetical protein